MGNKNSCEFKIFDLLVVELHIRKSIAVSTEWIFENRIKGDLSFIALENVPSMKDSGDFESHIIWTSFNTLLRHPYFT
jgi:hypothetical protein